MKKTIKTSNTKSLYSLLVIISMVFLIEVAIMLLLRRFIQHPNTLIEVLSDSTVLVVLLFPSLYYFMMRPMEREIANRERTEMELQEVNGQLESRVKQRTMELESANSRLEAEITERRRSEELLRESEEKFQNITASAKDAIILLDNEGNIGYWNKAAEEIFGYSAREAVGKESHLLLTPERYREAYRNGYLKFRETGDASVLGKTLELVAVRKDGTEFPIELSISAIRQKDGWNAIGVLRDITERKRMDEDIRRLSHQNELILGALGEGVYGIDLEEKATFINPAAAEMLGYQAQELIGQSMHEIIHHSRPDGSPYPREDCLIYTVLQDGMSHRTVDDVFWRKNGTSLPVEYVSTPIRDSDALAGAVVVFKDISERKRSEDLLRENEKRFRSLFENAPISLWEEDFSLIVAYIDELRQTGVTDFTAYFEAHPEVIENFAKMMKIIDINKETLKLYQAKSKDDFLEGIDKVFCDESFSSFREELIALADGKTVFEGEAINQTLTGNKIYITLSLVVVPSSGKISHRAFVSITDITKRKQDERALQQANEKLKSSVTKLEQHNADATLLTEMNDLLQACASTEEAYRTIDYISHRLFPSSSGALYIHSPSRDDLEAVQVWGDLSKEQTTRIFESDKCWALRRGRPHKLDTLCIGLPCRNSLPSHEGLCIPMTAQGESLGVLYLRSNTADNILPFNEQLVVTATEHIALALANLRLRETLRSQSIRDPLTDMHNRRFMEETLAREIRRAERNQRPLNVIMLDIDHFKQFNDTFGHEAGDTLLRELGQLLKANVRGGDVACRFGGEEFVLILPETTLDDAKQRAEELREKSRLLTVVHHGQALGIITISLGVATFPECAATAEALLRSADAALYRAKAEGRNRVVTAEVS